MFVIWLNIHKKCYVLNFAMYLIWINECLCHSIAYFLRSINIINIFLTIALLVMIYIKYWHLHNHYNY